VVFGTGNFTLNVRVDSGECVQSTSVLISKNGGRPVQEIHQGEPGGRQCMKGEKHTRLKKKTRCGLQLAGEGGCGDRSRRIFGKNSGRD